MWSHWRIWVVVASISFIIWMLVLLVNHISNDTSLPNLVLATLSTAATVFLAVSVRQLELELQKIRLESLNYIFNLFDDMFKEKLDRLVEEAKSKSLNLENSSQKSDLSRVSAYLNRLGYFIYRGYLDVDHVYELFGLKILKSFAFLRKYLEDLRLQNENPNHPWFFRRHYLMLIVALEHRFWTDPAFRPSLLSIYQSLGFSEPTSLANLPVLVPQEWLAPDVRRWLQKNKFLK